MDAYDCGAKDSSNAEGGKLPVAGSSGPVTSVRKVPRHSVIAFATGSRINRLVSVQALAAGRKLRVLLHYVER